MCASVISKSYLRFLRASLYFLFFFAYILFLKWYNNSYISISGIIISSNVLSQISVIFSFDILSCSEAFLFSKNFHFYPSSSLSKPLSEVSTVCSIFNSCSEHVFHIFLISSTTICHLDLFDRQWFLSSS